MYNSIFETKPINFSGTVSISSDHLKKLYDMINNSAAQNIRMKVICSDILPFEQTAQACEIETRNIVYIPTGRMIQMLEYNNNLFVSKEMYEKLKQL